MADPNTRRILSIDGGGARGYFSVKLMELFVAQWGINPNEIWKHFDVICGSSIGAIQALAYAHGLSPTDIAPFFTTDAQWIFSTSASTPSSRPSMLSKINTIVNGPFANPTFYPSTTDNIGTRRLRSKLESVFGTSILTDMKTNVLITAFEKNDNDPEFEQLTNTPTYFSNSHIIPVLSGQTHSVVDVAMATSAAPLYFPPASIGSLSYIDGGVVSNNPANIGIAISKAIKKTATRTCVLSIGTGLGDVGFGSPYTMLTKIKKEVQEFKESPKLYAEKYSVTHKEMEGIHAIHNLGFLEGAYLLIFLIGALNTAPQEAAAMELMIQSNTTYTLDKQYACRMQTYLDDDKDTELDYTVPSAFTYYAQAANDYYTANDTNITTFLGHLTA